MDNKTKPKRLLALDIMRGITIAGMLLVNNPGSWGSIYAPLRHAEWHGLTPTDLVFPFFMFIMGVSTWFSLKKYNFEFSAASLRKVLRRTVVIFAIGLGIAWLAKVLYGIHGDRPIWDIMTDFSHIRVLGVMPRLALCYCAASILAMLLRRKALALTTGALLVLYSILLIAGNGFEFSADNIICRIDHAVLGENHMYGDTVGGQYLKFDPEGLLSTLPSIAHVLIGFLCGGLITGTADNMRRTNSLFIVGAVLTFAGLLLSYGIPVNKKIWSPTFVLTTCGLASTMLALLITVIDIKGYRSWSRFFEAFGINPLFMYCYGTVFAVLLGAIHIGEKSIHTILYNDALMPLCAGNATLASLLYAIFVVVAVWLVGLILYKKKIYIKI
jgi:predicted acyltransferase